MSENINFPIVFLHKRDSIVTLIYIIMIITPVTYSLLFNLLIYSTYCQFMKPDYIKKNFNSCRKLLKNPHFDIKIVVGKPWRIYHTWNLNINTRCLDFVFQNATSEVVQRIWSDMSEYLEQQPIWETATLLMRSGPERNELLLFASQDAAGGFLAVPNVKRDANRNPMRRDVPLLRFIMKLVRGGKFLLIMDCQLGTISLSARSDKAPQRSIIAAVAAAMNIGDGYPACTVEKKMEE